MRTVVSRVKDPGTAHYGQMLVIDRKFIRGERTTVERDRLQLELIAVEHQRRFRVARARIAVDRQPPADKGVVLADVEIEIDGVDQECWRLVVLEMDRGWGWVAKHGWWGFKRGN